MARKGRALLSRVLVYGLTFGLIQNFKKYHRVRLFDSGRRRQAITPTNGRMVVVSFCVKEFFTFGRDGRSAFFLAVKPLAFFGGGASLVVVDLLVAAFSTNAFDVGAFF